MIITSEETKNLYKDSSGLKCLHISLRDAGVVLSNEDIVEESLEIKESLCESNRFKFGTANASQCKLKIFKRDDIDDLTGDEMTVDMSLVREDMSVDYKGSELFGKYGTVIDKYWPQMVKLYPDIVNEKYYVCYTFTDIPGSQNYTDGVIIWTPTIGHNFRYEGIESGGEAKINNPHVFCDYLQMPSATGGTYFMELNIEISELSGKYIEEYPNNVDFVYLNLSQLFYIDDQNGQRIIGTYKIKTKGVNRIRTLVTLTKKMYMKEVVILHSIMPAEDSSEKWIIKQYCNSTERRLWDGNDFTTLCICSCKMYKVENTPLGVFTVAEFQKKSNSMICEITAYDKLYKSSLDDPYEVECGNKESVQTLMDDVGEALNTTFGGTTYTVLKSYSPNYGIDQSLCSEYPDGMREIIRINLSGFRINDFDSSKRYAVNTRMLSDKENIRQKVFAIEREKGIIDKIQESDYWLDSYYNGVGKLAMYDLETVSEIENGTFDLKWIEKVVFEKYVINDIFETEYSNDKFGYGGKILESATINNKEYQLSSGRFGYSIYGNAYQEGTEIYAIFEGNKFFEIRIDNQLVQLNYDKYHGKDNTVSYHVFSDIEEKIKYELLNCLTRAGIGQEIDENNYWFYNPYDEENYDYLLQELLDSVTTSDFDGDPNDSLCSFDVKYIGYVKAYYENYEREEYYIGNNILSIDEYHNTEWLMEYSITGEGKVKSTLRKIASAYYELQGLFFIIGRDGVPKTARPAYATLYPSEYLYPNETLYPNEFMDIVPTGTIKELSVYENSKSLKYYGVKLYKGDSLIKNVTRVPDGYTQQDIISGYIKTHGYLIYEVKNNFILNNFTLTSEQLSEIANNILDNIMGMEIVSAEMEMVGLPYVECGDLLHVHDVDKDIDVMILTRTLKGIQSLNDSVKNKI